jgi:HEAT repeat protein
LKVAAVRGLGKCKDPRAAAALVVVLREAQNGKDVDVRDRTVAALKSVTGKDHGADAQAWAGYLHSQGLDASVPPAGPGGLPESNPVRTVGHTQR